MAKRIITNDSLIKKLVIEDITKIYLYFNKGDEFKDVLRIITYQSKTDSGFQKMINMAKKMARRTSDRKVQLSLESINFLMGFYKRGQK